VTGTLATLFLNPMTLSGFQHALLLLPLCLSVSVVYKTVRCAEVRQIPVAAMALWATIVVGMYAVGVGLYVLFLIVT